MVEAVPLRSVVMYGDRSLQQSVSLSVCGANVVPQRGQPYVDLAQAAEAEAVAAAAVVRVRFHIIRNARIENVGKYQSCMVSKLRIIWKQTVLIIHRVPFCLC